MKKYFQSFLKYKFLLSELVKKGIKLKYRRSYLGIIWTLIEPLLTMIVLSVVFSTILGKKDPTFPVYILTGRLLYSFFSQSTSAAMKSIRSNQAMIKKVYVPKYLYPLSCCVYNYIIFLISLIVLAVVSVVLHVYPTAQLIWAIIPLITLFFLSYGVGLILSTVAVFFRDMEYLWSVITMLIMYTCAIFYYPEKLLHSAWKGYLLKLNPLYCIIANFRNAVYGDPMNMKMMVYSIVFSIVAVIIGLRVFYKKQDNFILYI